MQDIVQVTRDMDKLGHIVVIELKMAIGKEVLNVTHGSCQQVVHPDHMVAFCQKPITEVRPDKTGCTGD